MKLKAVVITNFRAIEKLHLDLHPQLTVLYGMNGHGKTSAGRPQSRGGGSRHRSMAGAGGDGGVKATSMWAVCRLWGRDDRPVARFAGSFSRTMHE